MTCFVVSKPGLMSPICNGAFSASSPNNKATSFIVLQQHTNSSCEAGAFTEPDSSTSPNGSEISRKSSSTPAKQRPFLQRRDFANEESYKYNLNRHHRKEHKKRQRKLKLSWSVATSVSTGYISFLQMTLLWKTESTIYIKIFKTSTVNYKM